jgi:hypothetical protein
MRKEINVVMPIILLVFMLKYTKLKDMFLNLKLEAGSVPVANYLLKINAIKN